MAFIETNDEQLDPNAPQGQGQGQAPQVGSGSSIVGGSPGAGGAAGVGPGGTGGWTNIQAYLDANKGDTGSAQALSKTVGDQFGQERSAFQGDSSKFLTDAQGQADANKITNDQATGYIDQASKAYQYPGSDGKGGFEYAAPGGSGQFGGTSQQKATPKPNQQPLPSETDPTQQADYSGIVSKFQKALNDPYSGAKEYNYGFGEKTQQYGNDLKNDPSFDSLMKNVYSNAAQNPLTSGQYQLQKQFDVNNKALGDTRNSLNDQYAQLTADRDKTVQDTTTGLGNIEQGYRDSQRDLKDYLGQQSEGFDTKEKQAEAAAKSAYNTDLTTGHSGKQSVAMDLISHRPGDQQDQASSLFRNRGIWGDDLTWDQLQNENNIVKVNDQANGDNAGNLTYWDYGGTMQPELDFRKGMLNTFYNNEDQKYAGTADQDKRAYNSIQDFLNSTAAKKEQGFKVRG